MITCDKQWLSDLAKKKHTAYRLLFERYYPSLCIFAAKFVHDQELSKDLVQDLLCDMYRSEAVFTTSIALRAYLYNAIRNKCLNYQRKSYLKENVDINQFISDNDNLFVYSIIEEENYQLLHIAISTLPNTIQQIFRDSLAGYSNQEIAQRMELSIDSVKAYKKRGKRQLFHLLQSEKELYLLLLFISE